MINVKNAREYNENATAAAFLMGGIGTGNFSVGNRGQLTDWELFNSPGKGNHMCLTFFSVCAKQQGKTYARVLEGSLQPPFNSCTGFNEHFGLPRFNSFKMKAATPFVNVTMSDDIPLTVQMEGFSPFIPLNVDDSAIPCAEISYSITNTSSEPMQVTVAGSMGKFTIFEGQEIFKGSYAERTGAVKVEYTENELLAGLHYTKTDKSCGGKITDGGMALMLQNPGAGKVSHKLRWLDGGWFDGMQEFWTDLTDDGMLTENSVYTEENVKNGCGGAASLAQMQTVAPGETKKFSFLISWYFPNRVKAWNLEGLENITKRKYAENELPLTSNYYAALFDSAYGAAHYFAKNYKRLYDTSALFTGALYNSTLPCSVVDAVGSTITVLRSPTCFLLPDCTFMAWEGCFDKSGSCEGNCTHVWNYAAALAYLFPQLERSARLNELFVETEDNGRMYFRGYQKFGLPPSGEAPAADGQMGTVVRVYREWKLSCDNEFMLKCWPRVKLLLEFALSFWDTDGDFVMDASMHNTYDIEFKGTESLTNSLFYAALKAGAEMARAANDYEAAARYENGQKSGSALMDKLLWNGEYYSQKCDNIEKYRYQYGGGCLSDQVFGQTMAHLCGLGYILPKEHVRGAVKAVYNNNFKESLKNHENVQRTYALNGESGLLLCSWPHGGRTRIPFPYSDEVWTGIEYHVATHLIYEGFVDEGLKIVSAVRDRHDGIKRNPFNEVECGYHYARSLASFGVLLALSGQTQDTPSGRLGFSPKINAENFSCFYSNGVQWGVYEQKLNKNGEFENKINVLYNV